MYCCIILYVITSATLFVCSPLPGNIYIGHCDWLNISQLLWLFSIRFRVLWHSIANKNGSCFRYGKLTACCGVGTAFCVTECYRLFTQGLSKATSQSYSSHFAILSLLFVTHRRTVGDRSFAAAGPTLWNSLPHDITDCVSLTSFCRKLKLFCFLYHFHDYIFLFNGPWGFYLVCMYVSASVVDRRAFSVAGTVCHQRSD